MKYRPGRDSTIPVDAETIAQAGGDHTASKACSSGSPTARSVAIEIAAMISAVRTPLESGMAVSAIP
jgi:hypothetical protein